LAPEHGQSGPGTLAWPDDLARSTPTPFDWSLPEGFTVERDGHELAAASALPGEAARRILWLKSGDYRIAASPSDGWLWTAGCSAQAVVPSSPFAPDARFTVSAGCAGTLLAVAPAPGSQSLLGEISVEPLP